MSEMIERVAKELHEKLSSQDIDGYLGANFDLNSVARAAIEAMREPTAGMMIEGYGDLFRLETQLGIAAARYRYQAAIDAALNDKETA
ncbi:hypothetical protein PCC82_11260 [Agrobacterium deltaense]